MVEHLRIYLGPSLLGRTTHPECLSSKTCVHWNLFHPPSALNPVKFSPRTAMAVVIANMVSVGVFTSLGFQLLDFRSGFVLLMLWVVGGITALCGALSYAELGAALPRFGGEYNFLSRIYHPGAGFAAGWISASMGFAAPTALVALTFGAYLEAVVPWLERIWLAFGLIALLTFAHSRTRERSGRMQRWFTSLKILLIIAFCLTGWLLAPELQRPGFAPNVGDFELITSGAFAVALIYVNYAYTGWNAATYFTGELEDPKRNLSRVLVLGTLAVTLLYLLLNGTFLLLAPMDAMAGHEEIGHIAASHAFGTRGGNIMGTILALLFVSTASAMLMVGPRTLQCIGQDFPLFRLLARTNQDGVPSIAIYALGTLSLIFVMSASLEQLLVFAGFTLGVSSFLTVLGVFVLRIREPELERPYRIALYPLPPLVFLIVTGWTLVYIAWQRPTEALWGMAIIAAGAVLYFLSCFATRKKSTGSYPPERSRT